MMKRGMIVGADGSFRVIVSDNGYIRCRTFNQPSTVIRETYLMTILVMDGTYSIYDSDGEVCKGARGYHHRPFSV